MKDRGGTVVPMTHIDSSHRVAVLARAADAEAAEVSR